VKLNSKFWQFFLLGKQNLVKSTPGVNFINVLWPAFTCADTKCAKKKDSQVVSLFYAFGICARKSCLKNIDEINTSGVVFINILHTAFTPVATQSVRTQSSCQYLFMLLGATRVIAVRRTMMKLTPDLRIEHLLVAKHPFQSQILKCELIECQQLARYVQWQNFGNFRL